MKKEFKKSIEAINKQGALLVYPIKNKKEPLSLWSCLYPRSEMRWVWDEDGDDRVMKMWSMREELSRSREVVYAKWYQGRATFFSREVFVWLLAYLNPQKSFSRQAEELLQVLRTDSPISTKELKAHAGLQGRSLEGLYNKSMKELWNPLWIVGFGEVQDSSFPSLAVGATSLLFEELWEESQDLTADKANDRLEAKLGAKNPFLLYARKVTAKLKE